MNLPIDAKALITEAIEITDSYTDVGSPINCKGYENIGVWLKLDVEDSTSVTINFVLLVSDSSEDEYRLVDTDNQLQVLPDLDGNYFVQFTCDKAVPYIQVQVKDDADGDGEILEAYYTRGA